MFVIPQKTIDEMKLVLESEGYTIIKTKQFKALEQQAIYYQALVEYGVDNWSGFGDAMQSLESEAKK